MRLNFRLPFSFFLHGSRIKIIRGKDRILDFSSWDERNLRLILEKRGDERNEQRNVVARANLWVYLITKFALRREGLTMEASNVDCLTCKLRHCLPPFALLAPGDTGNFECNETTMFKLQTVSSIQSQFVRHETGWNELAAANLPCRGKI